MRGLACLILIAACSSERADRPVDRRDHDRVDDELRRASAALDRASKMAAASAEFREQYPKLELALDRLRTSEATAAVALLDTQLLPLLVRTREAVCTLDLPPDPATQLVRAQSSQACQLSRLIEDSYRGERSALSAHPFSEGQRAQLKRERGVILAGARLL